MANEQKQLKPHKIAFELYAYDEQEVAECRQAIIDFINLHAQYGRAVTAKKVGKAVSEWDKNIIVKNKIINFFKTE